MDITDIILDEHHKQRQLFQFIQEIDRSDVEALASVWRHLANYLDVHAEAEERFFYPHLLKEGHGAGDSGSATEETRDAIKDHNEIRDAAKAVEQHDAGTDGWFKAICKADLANSEHMAEEERQGLADFRRSASVEERHRLGVQFLAFVSEHFRGIKPVDKDPDKYVKEHEREPAEA